MQTQTALTDLDFTASLAAAQTTLLEPNGLALPDLDKILGNTLISGIDSADLYFQARTIESWVLEDAIIKDSSFHFEQGVGLRAVSGEKIGFAYSDTLSKAILDAASNSARTIALSGLDREKVAIAAGQPIAASGLALDLAKARPSLYSPLNPITSLDNLAKVEFLHELNHLARSLDPRIQQVIVALNNSYETIFYLDSMGNIAADQRPLVRLSVQVIAADDGRRESGFSGMGGRYALPVLLQKTPEQCVREAVRMALLALTAKPAPAGLLPVVLGPGWTGVLLHEAVGHGLEGDFNRKGSSAFSGKIGQKIASDLCTVVDDGTLPDRRGSLNCDDEGVATQRTVLIEDGILRGYMQDRLNAKLMGMACTGNGRRESYAHLPMPRMTNTFMLAGKDEPAAMIKGVKKGLYAVNFGGGQVDITSGQFVFNAVEAYMIENGEVTYPVKGATLIGNGPDVMTKIVAVGNDFGLDEGIGTCGKNGQSVPVGVGQPSVLISEMTVGGTGG